MKWFVTQTKEGESAPDAILGPFDTEEAAGAQRDALVADFPADAISDPFQEEEDYLDTLPAVKMIVATSEGDVEVYTDGTRKPVA